MSPESVHRDVFSGAFHFAFRLAGCIADGCALLPVFVRPCIPLFFLVFFILDIGNWIIHGAAKAAVRGDAEKHAEESEIIALLIYMDSQITYFTACMISFGFILKIASYQSVLRQTGDISGFVFCKKSYTKAVQNFQKCWFIYGSLALMLSLTLFTAVYVMMIVADATNTGRFYTPNTYLFWTFPYTPLDIFQRSVVMLARSVPFCFYVTYFVTVTFVISYMYGFNLKLYNSIYKVRLGMMNFEEAFPKLKWVDEKIAHVIEDMSAGFSMALASALAGHFLSICSLSSRAFVPEMLNSPFAYVRLILPTAASTVILVIFLVTGIRLHDSKASWKDNAQYVTFLYKITHRVDSFTLGGFVHLTRKAGATLAFTYLGYLCFLIERSEQSRMDSKLGIFASNSTGLGHQS